MSEHFTGVSTQTCKKADLSFSGGTRVRFLFHAALSSSLGARLHSHAAFVVSTKTFAVM